MGDVYDEQAARVYAAWQNTNSPPQNIEFYIAAALRAAADVAMREAAPTDEQMLDAYEAEINSRGIPPASGPEYRAARLSLIRGTLTRLPAPPHPGPVAVAREAMARAAMDRHNFQGGALDACDAVERKLDEACDALVALEAPQAAPAKHACHDCGCKIPAEFDLCGNCQMGRDEGEPT